MRILNKACERFRCNPYTVPNVIVRKALKKKQHHIWGWWIKSQKENAKSW
jgi:hypothetical protein